MDGVPDLRDHNSIKFNNNICHGHSIINANVRIGTS